MLAIPVPLEWANKSAAAGVCAPILLKADPIVVQSNN